MIVSEKGCVAARTAERRMTMRLIDADALSAKIETLMNRYAAQGRTEVAEDYNFVLTVLMTAETIDPESLRPKGRWIPVTERLPEENEYVMIWCGKCQIARIEKGISEEQRKAMKRGELDDPCETGWTLSSGYFTVKRSQTYKACDEQGNNRVPYCWYANGGPMKWFGQEVTHWAYLPQPPKGE